MIVEANCFNCGRREFVDWMTRINSPSKGYFYLCDDCLDEEDSYHSTNDILKRKPAKHGMTFGFEFETAERNVESNLLYQYDFLPTYDGSIGGTEWKSPIYRSMRGLAKMFRSIENVTSVGDTEGTHLNVGTFSRQEMDYIRRFYHSLFIPLCRSMEEMPHETERLFGRNFTIYAQTIDGDSDPCNHCNFINVESSNRIEFRLCKFKNTKQYMNLIKMHSEFVTTIRNNFLNHFNRNDHSFDTNRNFRFHKAKITANKIVKIFEKYANKI